MRVKLNTFLKKILGKGRESLKVELYYGNLPLHAEKFYKLVNLLSNYRENIEMIYSYLKIVFHIF